MYALNYKVTTSTCDANGKLKLYAALQMMQDCSEMWIESESGVERYFREQGMTQLLASRQVDIVRVPSFKEELRVVTTVYEMKPMFGFRNTFIYDAQGRPCYKTWSMGAFVDRQTGKLKRVDDATISSMHLEPQLEMEYLDRRIMLPLEEPQCLENIPVLRNDIDYNQHMNNANYIRIALELLPTDFQVHRMRVEFRMPAKLGDSLTPHLYNIEGGYIVSLMLGDNVSTLIEFK